MKKVAGFKFAVMCFPLHEWSKWHWGRGFPDQYFAVGPMRFGIDRILIHR